MDERKDLLDYFVNNPDKTVRTIRNNVLASSDLSEQVCIFIDELNRRGMIELPIDETTNQFLRDVIEAWEIERADRINQRSIREFKRLQNNPKVQKDILDAINANGGEAFLRQLELELNQM